MAREIKFRGRIRQGKWLVGEILSLNSHKYIAPNDGDWFDFIEWVPENVFHAPDSDKYEVEENTIGQYTGLHDKNGKEIYEGDFVRFHMHERGIYESEYQTGLVEFGGGRFYADLDCSTLYFCGEPDDYEVIGNIYDNPELIKVED